MDLTRIRQLLAKGSSVVLMEEGHPPLLVTELPEREEVPQEVPIASRWPKGRPAADVPGLTGRSLREEPAQDPGPVRQEQVLERLNKEILALREQIAQDEGSGREH